MPILILLGAVIIVAAIGLIFTSKGGADNNSDVAGLLDKLKGFASSGMGAAGAGVKEADKPDKYEKSDDGKVVYAFKPKADDENSPDGEGSDANERADIGDDSGDEDA
jgi:hypothetical protein